MSVAFIGERIPFVVNIHTIPLAVTEISSKELLMLLDGGRLGTYLGGGLVCSTILGGIVYDLSVRML